MVKAAEAWAIAAGREDSAFRGEISPIPNGRLGRHPITDDAEEPGDERPATLLRIFRSPHFAAVLTITMKETGVNLCTERKSGQ